MNRKPTSRAVTLGLLTLVTTLVVASCGGPSGPPATKARLTGQITVGVGLGAGSGTALSQSPGSAGPTTGWVLDESLLDFVPGDLIVRFAHVGPAEAGAAVPSTVEAASLSFDHQRSFSGTPAQYFRAGTGLDHAQTLAAARELNARDDVLYAHPNYIFQPLAVPNDPGFGLQWHYPLINLPAAWDITTGLASTVVAVVDSGILYSTHDVNWRHPDLVGRILPGYDFISEPAAALDGDGRDDDPFDNFIGSQFHGSHVAGTIGAATNNNLGVAGVDWHARVLPVRVMGQGGGNMVDIYEGVLWATGFSIPGVPDNPNPADIINMSLGADGACFPLVQEVLDAVTQHAIVVVAAGNDNKNVALVNPASCAGVITVGATDLQNVRAPYSNYGSRIDVMAPGGDVSVDRNDDGFIDGVLSLGYDVELQEFNYRFMDGTSMASPHVAGVISLMKALEPNIDTAGALAALRASAAPLSPAACHGQGPSEARNLGSDDCGAGLINAALALAFVQGGGPGPGPGPGPGDGPLAFNPSALNMGEAVVTMPFTMTNAGATTVSWSLDFFETAVDNPAMIPNGVVIVPDPHPLNGALMPGQAQTMALQVNRDGLTADGNYQIQLIFDLGGGEEQRLLVRFSRSAGGGPGLSGPMVVQSFVRGVSGQWSISGGLPVGGVTTHFDFDADPGPTIVGVWSDENDNGVIDSGDYLGFSQEFNARAGNVYDVPMQIAPVVPGSGSSHTEDWMLTLEQARMDPGEEAPGEEDKGE